ncbi:MAG: hypothetical protein KIT82_23335, partial [Bradyrhizobium sp.]|nr:hypothetical protein [Bradyrhizobium sp.]
HPGSNKLQSNLPAQLLKAAIEPFDAAKLPILTGLEDDAGALPTGPVLLSKVPENTVDCR